jgi:hypothetical protein
MAHIGVYVHDMISAFYNHTDQDLVLGKRKVRKEQDCGPDLRTPPMLPLGMFSTRVIPPGLAPPPPGLEPRISPYGARADMAQPQKVTSHLDETGPSELAVALPAAAPDLNPTPALYETEGILANKDIPDFGDAVPQHSDEENFTAAPELLSLVMGGSPSKTMIPNEVHGVSNGPSSVSKLPVPATENMSSDTQVNKEDEGTPISGRKLSKRQRKKMEQAMRLQQSIQARETVDASRFRLKKESMDDNTLNVSTGQEPSANISENASDILSISKKIAEPVNSVVESRENSVMDLITVVDQVPDIESPKERIKGHIKRRFREQMSVKEAKEAAKESTVPLERSKKEPEEEKEIPMLCHEVKLQLVHEETAKESGGEDTEMVPFEMESQEVPKEIFADGNEVDLNEKKVLQEEKLKENPEKGPKTITKAEHAYETIEQLLSPVDIENDEFISNQTDSTKRKSKKKKRAKLGKVAKKVFTSRVSDAMAAKWASFSSRELVPPLETVPKISIEPKRNVSDSEETSVDYSSYDVLDGLSELATELDLENHCFFRPQLFHNPKPERKSWKGSVSKFTEFEISVLGESVSFGKTPWLVEYDDVPIRNFNDVPTTFLGGLPLDEKSVAHVWDAAFDDALEQMADPERDRFELFDSVMKRFSLLDDDSIVRSNIPTDEMEAAYAALMDDIELEEGIPLKDVCSPVNHLHRVSPEDAQAYYYKSSREITALDKSVQMLASVNKSVILGSPTL